MSSEDYFNEYGPIQVHKHALIKRYLDAWFPKIASFGKVVYMETHAGRGIHKGGQPGSPIVAIQALLEHPQSESILRKCQVHFYLMELREEYAQSLEKEIRELAPHNDIKISVARCDFAQKLEEELRLCEMSGKAMPPSFVFMDPFNYKIPMKLVKGVLKHRSCEVIMNFMARNIAMAARDDSKKLLLDDLFGSDVWMQAKGVSDFDKQMESLVEIYKQAVGAKWTTKLRLTGQTDYTLMHFTNHDEGRVTMKTTIWALTGKYGKAGSEQLLVDDHPDQAILVSQEPNLNPLEQRLRNDFLGKSFSYGELEKWLLSVNFLAKHLHNVLVTGRTEGWLETKHKKAFGPAMRETMTVGPGTLL